MKTRDNARGWAKRAAINILPRMSDEWYVPKDVKIVSYKEAGTKIDCVGYRYDFTRPEDALKSVRLVKSSKADIENMLDSFQDLAKERIEIAKFKEFAKQWGPLGLCGHGFPTFHEAMPFQSEWCTNMHKTVSGYNVEPIARWRHYARELSAAWRLANSLAAARTTDPTPGNAKDWELLPHWYPLPPWHPSGVPADVMLGRYQVSEYLTNMMMLCGVRPRLHWYGETPQLTIWNESTTAGQCGQIVGRIVLIIAGAAEGAICKNFECGQMMPSKTPDGLCKRCHRREQFRYYKTPEYQEARAGRRKRPRKSK